MFSRIPILMYHQVGRPSPRGTPSRSLTVSVEDFDAQMRFMKKLGYQGLSMQDLLPFLRGEKTGKVFGITFDDGYRNVHDNALPILKRLGFTSTNYFVSSEINGVNRWDLAKGIAPSPLMSAEEILHWQAEGQEVGAHTVSHPRLSDLTAQAARVEIFQCKQDLEAICGREVTAFCYPHGGVNPMVQALVAEAGYTNATTTRRANAAPSDDALLIPRLTVRRGEGWFRLLFKCLRG